MSIGNRIRIARENAGLTQPELGKLCGTTKQTIYKYESGIVTNIPLDRIEAIASVLNVSSASLLGWEEISPGELALTEGEKELIEIFRLIPEDKQRSFLERGREFANSLRKG